MPTIHIVKQGDHLSSIAKKYGLPRKKIWNDPHNAALAGQRLNPNVLYPGDQVYIPDLTPNEFARPTDVNHKFAVDRQKVQLCLVLEDIYERPIANASCLLQCDGDSIALTSDSAGTIKHDIPADLQEATLTVQSAETPFKDERFSIKIGHLDPVDQITGQLARLNNLGYFAGDVGRQDTDALESAVEEFQCDQGLTVDGVCGPQTQAQLKKVHGC